MKRIKWLLMILIIIPFKIKALNSAACVDEWRDGVAYCYDNIVCDVWASDYVNGGYVLLDENGHKVRTLDNLEDDPMAEKGKLTITAKGFEKSFDSTIKFNIFSDLYSYDITLNKDNNYQVSLDVIEDLYVIGYHEVSDYKDIPCPITYDFRVYKDKTTNLELDYSNYIESNVTPKEKKKNPKMIIVYIAIGVFALFFIIVILMIIKAKNV